MSSFLRGTIIFLAIAAAFLGGLALFTAFEAAEIERAHPPAGRFIAVDGGRLHVVELGRSASRNPSPVVLLHGSSTNLSDMKLALGERLAAHYRVILLDRPGHGWSTRPHGRVDASPSRQAQLVHQALMRMGIARPILIAHSWSGALAMAYALAYPRNVAGLVLLAPVTHPTPSRSGWHESVVAALLAESARTASKPVVGRMFARTLALPLGKLLSGYAVQSAFAPNEPPSDYLDRTGGELLLRPTNFVANAQDLAAIDDAVIAQTPKYPDIKTPTVILTGDSDATAPRKIHADAIAAAMPHAKLIVLSGVGHMLHFAAPDRVVEAVAILSDGAALARSDNGTDEPLAAARQ